MSMKRVLFCWLSVLLLASCGTAAGGDPANGARPATCKQAAGASPTGASGAEQSVAFPHDGGRVEVSLQVGEHFSVRWSGCREHGRITTSPEDSTGPLFSSDISVYSSPRPAPSSGAAGVPCCQRPPGDGVFSVRYLAQMPGKQVLHGRGSDGSNGDVAVTVLPLTRAQGRLVSGVVDASSLHQHPRPAVVYFEPSGVNPTQTMTKPTATGQFSTRLRPGTYTIMAVSPAYNDGRAQCILKQAFVVAAQDVHGIKVVCTERT
jgi:hypothetical protein